MTVPQIRGMFGGDRSRKEVLVEFGFRLPSAVDNRPLNFEEFEERMAARLSYPAVDPHGDPIPTKDGTLTARKERALLAMQPGESAQITHINDTNSEMLRYAANLGLTPATRLTLIEAGPFGGSLR
jgi:hypothetical protein